MTGFHCVALVALELALWIRLTEMHLPLPPECWDYRCAQPHKVQFLFTFPILTDVEKHLTSSNTSYAETKPDSREHARDKWYLCP